MASDSEPKRDRWRARIKRFEERQRKAREWINFGEIAQWCSEEDFPPNEDKRAWAFDLLATDLLDGEFQDSRSRVHFLHFYMAKRVTPEWFKEVIDHNWDRHHGRFILERCWFPRPLFERWRARHRLEKYPRRFEPLDKGAQPARPQRPKERRKPDRERAQDALKALYPNGVPDQAIVENKILCKQVDEKLKELNQPEVSDDTILRAADRRK